MNKFKIILLTIIVGFSGCSKDFLDLQPTNKISADDLLGTAEGVKAFLANLYYRSPIEDFNWCTQWYGGGPFNFTGNIAGMYPIVWTDEAVNSEYDDIHVFGENAFMGWWEDAYRLNKDITMFANAIPGLSLSEEKKASLKGQVYFLRAYTYFELAKMFGGVPLITEIADINDSASLFTPRSTEKETWDFILANCDSAIVNLGEGDGTKRSVDKWVALALKSRAALFAASVAKYWDKAPLSGEAVNKKLVGGMTNDDAQRYYAECIDASKQIIEGGFSLYKANPANPAEAAQNFYEMFSNPNAASSEVIFIRGYTTKKHGHMYQDWGQPNQTKGTWPHPGRFDPVLDFVDAFETYSNPGKSAPIITTVDGNYNNYSGYNPSRNYIEYDNPMDIFADKDARLQASVILPMATFKGTKIIIQGGIIKTDGTPVIEESGEETVDGKVYHSFGNANPNLISGFYPVIGTRSGFLVRKYLQEDYEPEADVGTCTNDWIEIRLGEVYLNYMEAVAESGQGDASKAEEYLNALRHRAGHTTDIPLTLENVLRERRVELAFENKRIWDLIRRREYHEVFNNSYRHSLVPVLDLRSMKYIFIRKNVSRTHAWTFPTQWYYKRIPGISSNHLIQNPQY